MASMYWLNLSSIFHTYTTQLKLGIPPNFFPEMLVKTEVFWLKNLHSSSGHLFERLDGQTSLKFVIWYPSIHRHVFILTISTLHHL